jgi:hypothetical protein
MTSFLAYIRNNKPISLQTLIDVKCKKGSNGITLKFNAKVKRLVSDKHSSLFVRIGIDEEHSIIIRLTLIFAERLVAPSALFTFLVR